MKRFTVLSFFSVLAVFTAIVSGAVQAKGSDDFALPPEYVAQIPLSNAGSRIQDITRDNDFTGLLGIRLDNENSAVLVHWHGKVPSEVSDFIASSDVTITVVSVPYSLDELQAEIHRITETRQHRNVIINSIGINDTFDGIRIGFTTEDSLTRAEQTRAAKEAITSSFPLSFEVKEAYLPFRDRWDDQDPFYGGAAMDYQV